MRVPGRTFLIAAALNPSRNLTCGLVDDLEGGPTFGKPSRGLSLVRWLLHVVLGVHQEASGAEIDFSDVLPVVVGQDISKIGSQGGIGDGGVLGSR